MVAPIVVTILLALWLLIYAGAILTVTDIPPALRLLIGLGSLGLLGVSVFVLIERIREIKSGEEDDLDRY